MVKFNWLNRLVIKTEDDEKGKGLKMEGNFVVIFYLHAILITMCTLLLAVELIYSVYSRRDICVVNQFII